MNPRAQLGAMLMGLAAGIVLAAEPGPAKDSATTTVLMQNHKLDVTLLGESVIVENGWYVSAVRRFDGGLLVAQGSTPGTGMRGIGVSWWRISRDEGATWQPYRPEQGQPDYTRAAVFGRLQRRDGSIVGWADEWNASAEYQGRPGQPMSRRIIHAASWDALVRGGGQTAASTVFIPYLTPLTGDDSQTHFTAALWGKLVETEHGHLLQAAAPVLAYDRTGRLWPGKTEGRQYRTCVLYSQDDGATWHYLATVASVDHHPLPAQAEGYCEPDLLCFGGGQLLCVMRTGGNLGGRLSERCTPLVVSRSGDGGLNWSPPAPIAAQGVKPVLLKMGHGPVVCLSGRPGFFLLFSRDDGRTWSTSAWVSESDGPWGKSASGYGELVELGPGILGVAYDEYCGQGEEARMVAKFRRYRIGPVEPR